MRRQGRKYQSTNARHLITIQYHTQVSDGEGGYIQTWVDRPDIWAEICPMSASQKFEYSSINVDATHIINILGNLTLQANTMWVADIWNITWMGLIGANVQIDYQIDGGSWVSISASEPNNDTYDWTIPITAIGRNIIVRVMSLSDPTSLEYTDQYNIVAEGTRDGLPLEHDRIKWTVNNNTRIFEIKTVENIQERNIQAVLTCLEKRD